MVEGVWPRLAAGHAISPLGSVGWMTGRLQSVSVSRSMIVLWVVAVVFLLMVPVLGLFPPVVGDAGCLASLFLMGCAVGVQGRKQGMRRAPCSDREQRAVC